MITILANAQVEKSTELYKTIKEKDSLLFNIGFNNCDITQFKKLVSDNFEFYHDQGGITNSKAEFIQSIENGNWKLSKGLSYDTKPLSGSVSLETKKKQKDGENNKAYTNRCA